MISARANGQPVGGGYYRVRDGASQADAIVALTNERGGESPRSSRSAASVWPGIRFPAGPAGFPEPSPVSGA
jgi:hypothetical protein